MVTLGDIVTDSITGFTGKATGLCSYITGCDQVLVQPSVKDGAYVEGRWLDITRVDPTATQANSGPGADIPAPIK